MEPDVTEHDGTYPGRYIRLDDGTLYHYTDLLATRRDASIVDEYTAAQYMRAQGVDNELTQKYPATAALGPEYLEAIPTTAKAKRDEMIAAKNADKAAREERKAKVARMSAQQPDSDEPETLTNDEVEGSGVSFDPISVDPVVRELLGNDAHRS